MSYTIAVLEEIHTGFTVDFSKMGNKYLIYIKQDDATSHNTYDSIEDAALVFGKLSQAVITGCYSFEDRIAML